MMLAEQTFPDHGPLFKFLFTNIWFLGAFGISWVTFSIYLSRRYGTWHWFARSGAILAIVGGMLSCRTILRRTSEYRHGILHLSMIETLSEEEFVDIETDEHATIIGVIFIVSGSLIWAYGDLIGRPLITSRSPTL